MNWRFLLCFHILSSLFYLGADEAVLILNARNEENLPRNFRTCLQTIASSSSVSRTGLADLRISGSAQFSDLELNVVQSKIPQTTNITIVDLRAECHGFINGIAVSWYTPGNWENLGKTPDQIIAEENKRLAALSTRKEVVITKVISRAHNDVIHQFDQLKIPVSSVSNEKDLTKKHKLDYKRFFVMDHKKPNDEQVEAFVKFVRELPSGTWLHFHCAAGLGRTTSFMSMYDMLRNAKEVSFNDIIARQHLIGGDNLKKTILPENKKYRDAKDRLEFLQNFYNYAKNNRDGFKTGWQDHLKQEAKVPVMAN